MDFQNSDLLHTNWLSSEIRPTFMNYPARNSRHSLSVPIRPKLVQTEVKTGISLNQ